MWSITSGRPERHWPKATPYQSGTTRAALALGHAVRACLPGGNIHLAPGVMSFLVLFYNHEPRFEQAVVQELSFVVK